MQTVRRAGARRGRPWRRLPQPFGIACTVAVVLALGQGPGLGEAVARQVPAGAAHTSAGAQDEAALSQSPSSLAAERAIKAAMLVKFLGYIDFPGGPLDPGTPYVVGVAGAEDIASELARLATGRTVNNHSVLVRRVHEGESMRGACTCCSSAPTTASTKRRW